MIKINNLVHQLIYENLNFKGRNLNFVKNSDTL